MKGAVALRNPVGTAIANDCSSTNITSAAYVQLTSSLSVPCSGIEVQNTSAKAIQVAIGGAGSEVVKWIIAPSVIGTIIPAEFKKGVRIAAKALGADATTGFLIINFLG